MTLPPFVGTYIFDNFWDDARGLAKLFRCRLEGAATLYWEQAENRTRTPANVSVREASLNTLSL